MTGGERLSGKNRDLVAPARAVLMDASWRIFIQSQIDDYDTVTSFNDVVEGGGNGGRGGPPMPGGFGGPAGRGMEGYGER